MGTTGRSAGAGCALAMSDELHDWLADLRDSDELIAGYVVQALAALMQQGASLADPLVASTEDAWPSALAEELNRRCGEILEALQPVRRLAAESADAATAERVARLHSQADAFRVRKEVLTARYVAAQARLVIYQSLAAAGPAGDDDGQAGDEGAESVSAKASLLDVIAEMERELGLPAWPDGLMEMRPGAPGDIGIRVLFAIEPPGTALLLSALEGPDAVKDHYLQAIVLSADILGRVRAGQEPDAAARGYEDLRSFLEEFQ